MLGNSTFSLVRTGKVLLAPSYYFDNFIVFTKEVSMAYLSEWLKLTHGDKVMNRNKSGRRRFQSPKENLPCRHVYFYVILSIYISLQA